MNLLLVMAGGAAGSGARFLVGRASAALFGPMFGTGWPWGTMIVNLAGSLAMGLLVGVLARLSAAEPWRLLLAVGVLGGFTTFSAFSLDTALMMQRGAWLAAAAYVAVSVIGSVAALFAGLALVRTAA